MARVIELGGQSGRLARWDAGRSSLMTAGRGNAAPVLSMLLIGAGAVGLLAWRTSDLARGLGGASLAIGVSLLAVQGAIRRREARTLDRVARSLLDWTPTGADPAELIRPIQGSGPTGELAGIRRSLMDLGRLLTGQIKELAKRTRNLESLLDALDEPILATGEGERVILFNRSAEELLGRGSSLVGRPVDAVLTQQGLLEIHRAARNGETRRGRVRVTTALGARVFQVSAAPLPPAWGQGVFGAVLLLRDVTELDRAEQVRSDFVANASHELRTPIAAIRGAIETLASSTGGHPTAPEVQERLLAMALRHADRLEEMTRDLLDLSRLESPESPVTLGPVDWEQIESALSGMFEEICRARRLELSIHVDPELAGAHSDAVLLALILRNLLENATRFAFEGTAVRVTIARDGVSRGRAALEAVLRLEVTDRGIGIPLHLRDRVFERYFQVDAARTTQAGASGTAMKKGTGLGLAIVKHAVRVLGGEVSLDSVYGEGTTVRALIPVTIKPVAAGSARAGDARRP